MAKQVEFDLRVAKEKVENELGIAAQIQKSILPSSFPPYPDRKEFELYALMQPARYIGGDFYDFFFVDGNTLALVIADVSDKGVPAALFMMVSRTLFLYTDGVTEAMSPDNELFGLDRLQDLLISKQDLKLDRLCTDIEAFLSEFQPGHQFDDITMQALKRNL